MKEDGCIIEWVDGKKAAEEGTFTCKFGIGKTEADARVLKAWPFWKNFFHEKWYLIEKEKFLIEINF